MENYRDRLIGALESLDMTVVNDLYSLLCEARFRGATVFVAGNGGSASTASHISNDWMLGTSLKNPALRVLALSDSNVAMTATANDQSFERIFSRQLEHLANRGDLLIAISASGNSPNLLGAIETARELGAKTVGITGFDGGAISRLVDLPIHVETASGDYGVAEDVHLTIGHMVKELLIEGSPSDSKRIEL